RKRLRCNCNVRFLTYCCHSTIVSSCLLSTMSTQQPRLIVAASSGAHSRPSFGFVSGDISQKTPVTRPFMGLATQVGVPQKTHSGGRIPRVLRSNLPGCY